MIVRFDDRSLPGLLAQTLRTGGIAIVPCDTIYGIVGRAPETEARIRAIKGRGETNPFLMLIATVKQAVQMADGPLDRRVTALWPAPLTIVMNSAGTTIALRVPADPFLRKIIRSVGIPVYSTSVNRSGDPPRWRFSDIARDFEHEVDFLVDAGDRPSGQPSTILDISRKPYRILRQGEYQVPPDLLKH